MKATIILLLIFAGLTVSAQDTTILRSRDTVIAGDTISGPVIRANAIDTITRTKHSPRKAAIRSAVIPGWGQIYNGKWWKVPIVYTAIGIPIGTFIYNKQWYDRTREAARMLGTGDTLNWPNRVHPQLYTFFSRSNMLGSLLSYRNDFRRNMDYSILFTLLFWGLNVVDATVDAHLKEFDVSDDISLKVKPVLMPVNLSPGISLVFTFGRTEPKTFKPISF